MVNTIKHETELQTERELQYTNSSVDLHPWHHAKIDEKKGKCNQWMKMASTPQKTSNISTITYHKSYCSNTTIAKPHIGFYNHELLHYLPHEFELKTNKLVQQNINGEEQSCLTSSWHTCPLHDHAPHTEHMKWWMVQKKKMDLKGWVIHHNKK